MIRRGTPRPPAHQSDANACDTRAARLRGNEVCALHILPRGAPSAPCAPVSLGAIRRKSLTNQAALLQRARVELESRPGDHGAHLHAERDALESRDRLPQHEHADADGDHVLQHAHEQVAHGGCVLDRQGDADVQREGHRAVREEKWGKLVYLGKRRHRQTWPDNAGRQGEDEQRQRSQQREAHRRDDQNAAQGVQPPAREERPHQDDAPALADLREHLDPEAGGREVELAVDCQGGRHEREQDDLDVPPVEALQAKTEGEDVDEDDVPLLEHLQEGDGEVLVRQVRAHQAHRVGDADR
mmetsp:Transcript_82234/g.230727  ORF Transcript_82234/g.230727 Transcript_82234/m.230727 type:complete len:299 (+) Transcript_82234:56-952(+)